MPRFGVAGYPPAFAQSQFGRDRMRIGEWLRSLGLDALELQMTYGPRTTVEKCKQYRRMAEDNDVKLSVHGSYFIVFTSDDNEKLARSRDTLKRTFELCSVLDADAIVLHPGSLYGHKNSDTVLNRCIDNLGDTMNEIGPTEIGLFVETAGKVGQLGSVDEILAIADQVPGVFPCIDFGHIHARTLGSLDSEESILSLFEKLDRHKCFDEDHRIHFHYTPIIYGPRGEIKHAAINDKVELDYQSQLGLFDPDAKTMDAAFYYPRFEPVAKGLRDYGADCTIISETYNTQEEGALALRDSYHSE